MEIPTDIRACSSAARSTLPWIVLFVIVSGVTQALELGNCVRLSRRSVERREGRGSEHGGQLDAF
jgi:hypothetical protein